MSINKKNGNENQNQNQNKSINEIKIRNNLNKK